MCLQASWLLTPALTDLLYDNSNNHRLQCKGFCAEQCNDIDACDIQEEMLRDIDVVSVECLEDNPMLVYAFGD